MNDKGRKQCPTDLKRYGQGWDRVFGKEQPDMGEPDMDEQSIQEEEYLRKIQWEENMNYLYHYGDDGFCDGFTKY